MRNALSLLSVLFLAGTGCGFDEGLTITNMQGKVQVPFAAATGFVVGADGERVEVVDRRFIGPVYLGLYSSVSSDLLAYPHPVIGPTFRQGIPGDTYPYGGTTVGDIRFACIEALTCRIASNRYVDLDEMVSWYNNDLNQPLYDDAGNLIESGAYFRQICYDLLEYTSDEEIRLTPGDRNEDGAVDEKDLDFVRNDEEEVFEANFTLYQQEFFSDDDGVGMSLWGFVDSPSESSFRFSTCDPQNGFRQSEYDANYFGGQQQTDTLNQPSQYISANDFVASEAYVYEAADDTPTLKLDFRVEN